MSETNAANQGANDAPPSTDGLYGQAKELVEAGYKPMPEVVEKEQPTFEDAREAAEALSASRTADPVQDVGYKTTEGEAVPANEVVSAERAAKDLSAYHNAQADSAAKSISADLAAEVDKLRAEAIKGDPIKAAHYGVDVPESEAKEAAPDAGDKNKSGDEAAPDSFDGIEGLDEETKKALKLPQVRQALEQQFTEAETARQTFVQGLTQAQTFAQASFLENFPELAGLPIDQLERGLHMLAEVNPQRFNAAVNLLNRARTIQAAQQQEQQRQAAIAQHQFQAFAREQDAQFEKSIPVYTPAEKIAFVDELVSYAGELGVSKDQLGELLSTQPIMRHAAFQRMIYDAVQARLERSKTAKARETVRSKVSNPIPHVQIPGQGASRGVGNVEQIRALEGQLAASKGAKALRLAAKISGLRRAASNR